MAEEKKSRTLEPGTLDKIRQNLGPIDPEEALLMQKKLGGEILKERSLPVDTSNMPKRRTKSETTIVRSAVRSPSDNAAKSAAAGAVASEASSIIRGSSELPDVSPRVLKRMNKLMMTPGFDIKPDYGIFNFLYQMSARNKDRLQPSFGNYLVNRHVEHIQNFITAMKSLIQISPDVYKAKIATESDMKFKILRTVGKWTMRDIKVLSLEIDNNSENLTVPMLIPFIRAVYRQLLAIYYVGDNQVSLAIKEVREDLVNLPNVDSGQVQMLTKQAATEWLYINDQVIKGLYPLLMRMCSTNYFEYPEFFKAEVGNILKFLGISKFDLLLPEKKKKEEGEESPKAEEKKPQNAKRIAGEKNEAVRMGLRILEQLFPEAGFSKLEVYPDLYPYFQPIYSFADGFNMLSPENPLQVTVVLIRIVEDLFKGCRNIMFDTAADERVSGMQDKVSDALNDWANYHEDLFDKKYGDYLRSYVNSIYSQRDFANTNFGKDNLNNILWRAKYYFLPHFKFNAPVLQKPINDSSLKPLAGRTDFLRTIFSLLVHRIDDASAEKKSVLGVGNPWARYTFDLPNAVSKRMDVLLGAKKDDDVTAATNANLIKYTLCIISVLDWWINNSSSPAYASDAKALYRISAKDGGPEFSAPVRTDQNTLFAEGVKKAIAAKKAK